MKPRYLLLLQLLFFVSCSENHSSKSEKKIKNQIYDQALAFHDGEKLDSAFLFFNKAKDSFLEQKDSLGIGKSLIYMGIIATDKGDHFGGMEALLEARSYLNTNKKSHFPYLQSDFNTLGIASFNLKNYTQAIDFYKQSLLYTKDSARIFNVKNNLANAYRENGDYKKSLVLYQQLLKQDIGDNKAYTRTLTNISVNKWLMDAKYNAVPDLLKALRIREQEQDKWGQNSSFSHLADYYTIPQPDSALIYARKMYAMAQALQSPDDQLDALKKLIQLSPQQETKRHFETYQKLNDSVQTARNAAKNQFALIRYETEKNKSNFLKSQADNIEKQDNILKKNIGLCFLGLCLVGGYFWYRKRKKILKQEKEIEVKKTELKYVKKVHDDVANKIYQVMMEVENTLNLNAGHLADQLEVIYNISRDLSYENGGLSGEKSFVQKLSKMLHSYASSKVELFIDGNEEELWADVGTVAKVEVYYILQELMTNMSKHSEAAIVKIQFKRADHHISVIYSDNGKGMMHSAPKNGLLNTENRIESISGRITFVHKPHEGLEIQFSFPIL